MVRQRIRSGAASLLRLQSLSWEPWPGAAEATTSRHGASRKSLTACWKLGCTAGGRNSCARNQSGFNEGFG